MDSKGPIIIIDDDADDRFLFEDAYLRLGYPNELKVFDSARKALEYLAHPDAQPFIIISDVNMPEMNGIEFRNALFTNPETSKKSVPFLFYTTDDTRHMIRKAYELPIQGIFNKPTSVAEFVRKLSLMLEYWKESMLL